ncbi:hypothetical protein D3C71_1932300 [compost metagenome]
MLKHMHKIVTIYIVLNMASIKITLYNVKSQVLRSIGLGTGLNSCYIGETALAQFFQQVAF